MIGAASIIAVVAAYILGGAPIGVLVARTRGVDLFEVGSGNVGTTNVVRALGFKYGILTWLGDVGKGALACGVARLLGQPPAIVAAAGGAAVFGHCYSPFLRLRGGRGIATSLGVLLVSCWPVGLVGFALWIVVMLSTRIVSLASLLAAASLVPLVEWLRPTDPLLVMTGFMTCLAFYRHYPNLERLLRGEERKFGSRKKEAEAE
jgi:glycerol-3-phosphate acyltransferase PlsY